MTPPHPEREVGRNEALSLLRSKQFSTVTPVAAASQGAVKLRFHLYGQGGSFQSITCRAASSKGEAK